MRIFAFFLFLFVSAGLWSQKYAFVTYSTEEGLPQSQVTAISQDDDGYLWVATLGGLAKFNGKNFITFSTGDGLLNNRVKTLNYFNSTLWIGHDGGISFIKNNKIESVGFTGNDKSQNVSEILEFKGEIYVTCNGGGLFILKNGQLIEKDLDEKFHRIRGAQVFNDHLYLATRSGILLSKDGKTFKLIESLPETSFSGVFQSEDHLYFTSYVDGVYRWGINGQIKHYSQEDIKHVVFGGYADSKGEIWLNSQNGAIRIDQNDAISFLDNQAGLPLNMISCFFEDSEGNLWLGSEGKGMFRFPGEKFKYYDQSSGLPSNLLLSGFYSKSGDYFLGTYDKGVVRRTPDGESSVVFDGEGAIWAAIEDVDNKNWFGTQSSLISLDEKGEITKYYRDSGIPGRKITAFYRISKNEMYIGGSEGVSLYKNGSFTKLNDVVTNDVGTVRDLLVYKGKLFCASNLGLFHLVEGKFESFKGVKDVVYNMKLDHLNNIWYGTEEGLFRFDGEEIEQIELRSNPASNYINFINPNGEKLFVGTNNGLFVLRDLSLAKPKIKRYGIGEGVVDLETNLNSAFFDQNNAFWFGTATAIVVYQLSEGSEKIVQPKIELKSILLNYQPFDYSKFSSELTPSGLPKELNLGYTKNNLIFELDGISLAHHRGLMYQFWLEGLNSDWSPLSENPTITFTNIPAGDYILRMRSVDMDGRLSEEIKFPFTIRPAFYKTWWFIGLTILAIAGLLYWLFRLRLRRINEINEKEKLEYKTRLLSLEQQSMNASMNRHFVFNSLNSIQYFINTQDRLSANKYLTNFAKLIRKNLDTATADGNIITLQEELERLELYLSLESMRFKDRFDYSILADGIDTEAIRIPAMIMQPFVENSIIHGILPNEVVKGHIKVELKKVGSILEVIIEDNGIGINQSISQKSDIDGDHRSKGMEITSKRIELIQKVSENGISLEGPYEFEDKNRSIKGTRVIIKIPLEDLEE